MTIPVMRPWLGEEEAAAAAAAIASGWIAQGPRVAEFERAFAAVIGAGPDCPVTVLRSDRTSGIFDDHAPTGVAELAH